jgi:hypothetical protein
MRIRFLFFLVLSMLSMASFADDKESVAIHGFDRMSCEDWLASEDNPDIRGQYIVWIRGIVTGYNFANPDNQVALGRMPGDISLGIFVNSYCRKNKTKTFAGAAFELIEAKRGSSGVQVMAPETPADPTSTDAFQEWLKRQSDDIRSLDTGVLRNIYKKEMALQSEK